VSFQQSTVFIFIPLPTPLYAVHSDSVSEHTTRPAAAVSQTDRWRVPYQNVSNICHDYKTVNCANFNFNIEKVLLFFVFF
jgi:hypothetical protein